MQQKPAHVTVPGQVAMGTTGNKRLHVNIRKQFFYCEGDQALMWVAGVSILGDIEKLYGHGPGQPALGGPA